MNKIKLRGASVKADFERKRKFSVAINKGNIDKLKLLSNVKKIQQYKSLI